MNHKVMKKILDTKLRTITFYTMIMPSIFISATIGATSLWLGSKKSLTPT